MLQSNNELEEKNLSRNLCWVVLRSIEFSLIFAILFLFLVSLLLESLQIERVQHLLIDFLLIDALSTESHLNSENDDQRNSLAARKQMFLSEGAHLTRQFSINHCPSLTWYSPSSLGTSNYKLKTWSDLWRLTLFSILKIPFHSHWWILIGNVLVPYGLLISIEIYH